MQENLAQSPHPHPFSPLEHSHKMESHSAGRRENLTWQNSCRTRLASPSRGIFNKAKAMDRTRQKPCLWGKEDDSSH